MCVWVMCAGKEAGRAGLQVRPTNRCAARMRASSLWLAGTHPHPLPGSILIQERLLFLPTFTIITTLLPHYTVPMQERLADRVAPYHYWRGGREARQERGLHGQVLGAGSQARQRPHHWVRTQGGRM